MSIFYILTQNVNNQGISRPLNPEALLNYNHSITFYNLEGLDGYLCPWINSLGNIYNIVTTLGTLDYIYLLHLNEF